MASAGAHSTSRPMTDLDVSLMRGTLDLLILKALSWGPRHGYAVADWIDRTTGAALLVGEGTLYPALHRLERGGFVDAEWGAVGEQPAGQVLHVEPYGAGPIAGGHVVVDAVRGTRGAGAQRATAPVPA